MDQNELKSILNYDSVTGIFTWKYRKHKNKVKAGDIAGFIKKDDGYRHIKINNKKYYAHILAWCYVYGVWPNHEVDHKNRIRDDNRIDNLRKATHQQNSFNTGKYKNNTSGYKGVSWDKHSKKWHVQYTYNSKNHHGGRFKNIEDAAKKYEEIVKELHKEFFKSGDTT